jgi:hypothetical protein
MLMKIKRISMQQFLCLFLLEAEIQPILELSLRGFRLSAALNTG